MVKIYITIVGIKLRHVALWATGCLVPDVVVIAIIIILLPRSKGMA